MATVAARRLRSSCLHVVTSAAVTVDDARAPATVLSAGKLPQRVPISDRAAIDAALKEDG